MTSTSYTPQWHDPNNILGARPINCVAGDVGGTKSWLVWFIYRRLQPTELVFERSYSSTDFVSATALLLRFFADVGMHNTPQFVFLALPGPVDQQQATLTNLDWHLNATELAAELGVLDVQLINDFQAAAAGVETLHKSDYLTVNPGIARLGATRVITGAGTGLGVAWMQPDRAGQWQVFASEGGHLDFAPSNREQWAVLEWLTTRHGGHVSWERVLSGDGLSALYAFATLNTGHECNLPAVQIHALALQGDALAVQAIQQFADIYAAWLGNLVLMFQPRGGLYMAGGVTIHLQSWLSGERFVQHMSNKGRMTQLIAHTPVYLITNARLGVQGAMHRAIATLNTKEVTR